MSKNTSSNAFRRIDVDAFSEDNFHDEDGVVSAGGGAGGPSAGGGGGGSSISSPDAALLGALLQQGKNVEALKTVLTQAPIGNKNQTEKDAALQLVLKVLLSIKAAGQVEAAVQQLDPDQRDVLMKYIYRGFEIPSEGSSAHLLLWHEKVFEEAGAGSIVRVLTDRKRV